MLTPGDDSDWRIWYRLGIEAEDPRAAKEHLDRAIDAGASQWEPFYARAWIIVQTVTADDDIAVEKASELLGDAVMDLDRALDEFGAGTDAMALRGHVAALLGDHETAVEFFLKAVGKTPQIDLVEVGLTDSLAALLAQLEMAAEDASGAGASVAACGRLERMLAVAPVNPALADELLAEVMATRAYCNQQAGHADEADADLRRVARLVPGHPRAASEIRSDGEAARPVRKPSREPDFSSVGGLAESGTFMATLRQLFETYFGSADAEATRQRLGSNGRSATRSILLFGPSGCGKTYVIQSFAGEYRKRYHREMPITKLRLDGVFERYVGDSEKAITRLVDQAIELQPSILFADEIDTIGRSRSDGQDWRIDITSHWLVEIDRLRDSGAAVIFFGCTNRIWAIDSALHRRFDRMMPVELPAENVRAQIFDVYLRALEPPAGPSVLDTGSLAARTHGLTPGDIRTVINRALDDLIMSNDATNEPRQLTEQDVLTALSSFKSDRPDHVREWVRESMAALRASGLDEMAAAVERTYGPYVGPITGLSGKQPGGEPAWQQMPPEAWTEQPEFDLYSLRQLRR